jgi:hypothetical protein
MKKFNFRKRSNKKYNTKIPKRTKRTNINKRTKRTNRNKRTNRTKRKTIKGGSNHIPTETNLTYINRLKRDLEICKQTLKQTLRRPFIPPPPYYPPNSNPIRIRHTYRNPYNNNNSDFMTQEQARALAEGARARASNFLENEV